MFEIKLQLQPLPHKCLHKLFINKKMERLDYSIIKLPYLLILFKGRLCKRDDIEGCLIIYKSFM